MTVGKYVPGTYKVYLFFFLLIGDNEVVEYAVHILRL